MTTHDGFLKALLDAFPGQVHLVGAYADVKLGLTDKTLRLFLPDFHWMSTACLQRYTGGYRFNGNALMNGAPMMSTLLTIIEDLSKEDRELFQLGDRVDLWRELTNEDEHIQVAYDRVRNDQAVASLADRLDTLGTRYIRGNHDAWLAEVENANTKIPRSFKELETAKKRVFLTHGHRYDNIELLLPDTVKATVVGLCPKIRPGNHDVGPFLPATIKHLDDFLRVRQRANYPPGLYPTVKPDGARRLTSTEDVASLMKTTTTYLATTRFLHGMDDRNDFEHASYLTFGDKIYTYEQNHPTDHTVYIIGHTHHARLLVDQLPGGRPLVTMDCGGWIEDCTIYDDKTKGIHRAPSAQVGVQCGNDLRIYQLGGSIPS